MDGQIMLITLRLTAVLVPVVWGTRELHMAWMVPETYQNLNGTSSVGTLAHALGKIEEQNILPGYHINVTWINSACDSKKAIGRLTDLFCTKDIEVIVGPPCSAAMTVVADLASFKNIPIFGWVSRQVPLDNKTRFSTLVRLSSPTSSLGSIFVSFCKSMAWYNVVMMSTDSGETISLADAMLNTFASDQNVDFTLVRHYNRIPFNSSDALLAKHFSKIKNEARVIFLVIPNEQLRQYLLVAHRLGMTGGDYQFLFTEQTIPDQRELALLQSYDVWRRGDGQDEAARQAFRNLLYFTYASITDFDILSTKTQNSYEKIFGDRPDMPPYSAKRDRFSSHLHDAVLMYAWAFKESLAKFNRTRGTDLYWICSHTEITFEGLTGEVHIDVNGDRLPSFFVWDMGPDGLFRSVYSIVFRMTASGVNRTLKELYPIYWGDGRDSSTYKPPDLPLCGFYDELCPQDSSLIVILISVFATVMMAFVIGALVFYRWWRSERDINNTNWKVPHENLDFNFRKKKGKSMVPILEAAFDDDVSLRSTQSDLQGKTTSSAQASLESMHENSLTFHQYTTVARYKGDIVAVKKIWKHRLHTDRKLLLHVKELHVRFEAHNQIIPSHDVTRAPFHEAFVKLRDLHSSPQLIMLKHINLTTFVGICPEPKNIAVLWEYCNKGSLNDILENTDMKLDSMFQFSISIDICTGLQYLHSSPLKYHGNLSSSNCVVDSRWVCKLTDFGLRPIRKGENDTSDQLSENDKFAKLYWLAPELLRTYLSDKKFTPSPQGDIFAFGIILKEILCLNKPYSEEQTLSPKEIVKRVAHPKDRLVRPVLLETQDEYTGLRQPFYKLVHSCWAEDPQYRPSSRRVLKRLTRLNPYRSASMLDNMIMMMERYSNHLEELVADRTAQLEEEKRKTDTLLYSMLPQKVADNLKAGKLVQAEAFESVSVYFSDIVGFTDIASESTPMEIVELLNTLYTLFDDTIKNYDVYKVETIGDAYMIASGVPVSNGDQHVMEMADAALCLLKAVLGYEIPHRPDLQLRIRIGVHSGPVVAGVVGLTMPRYCLFGDTVNTASRMESNGKPLMIHISPDTARLLKKHPLYHVADRGQVDIKGKGRMSTFWLQGKTGLFNVPVDDSCPVQQTSHPDDVTVAGSQAETVSSGEVAPSVHNSSPTAASTDSVYDEGRTEEVTGTAVDTTDTQSNDTVLDHAQTGPQTADMSYVSRIEATKV